MENISYAAMDASRQQTRNASEQFEIYPVMNLARCFNYCKNNQRLKRREP